MSKGHPEKVIDALYAGDVHSVERYVDAGNINLADSVRHAEPDLSPDDGGIDGFCGSTSQSPVN